jgi:hypothetical protein
MLAYMAKPYTSDSPSILLRVYTATRIPTTWTTHFPLPAFLISPHSLGNILRSRYRHCYSDKLGGTDGGLRFYTHMTGNRAAISDYWIILTDYVFLPSIGVRAICQRARVESLASLPRCLLAKPDPPASTTVNRLDPKTGVFVSC